jgi:lipoprotein-anchoring transpeptidase ErfK/SrfK
VATSFQLTKAITALFSMTFNVATVLPSVFVLDALTEGKMNRIAQKIESNATKTLVVTVLILACVIPLCAQDSAPDNPPDDEDDSNRTVLVSLVDRKLAVIEDGVVIATFQVAVGADVTPSPTGEFKVVSRVENPTYYRPGTVIPAGKNNPVGTRWMGLSQKGYGIHGTNAPGSIGHAASHGCIRLRNSDVEKLFTMVQVGDTVKIRGERDDEVAQIFGALDDKLLAEASQAHLAEGQ